MSTLPNIILVAVGVICNAQAQVLLAKRPPEKTLGGLWEFPGGKVEPGESVIQALARELQEEVGIIVQTATHLLDTSYRYPDRLIDLRVWRIEKFQGEPQGLEGQELRWVTYNELNNYKFPAANRAIIDRLQHPLR